MGGSTQKLRAVAVVLVRGERVLALRRSAHKDAAPGAWETVSGRAEAGEALEATALREAEEETGLPVLLDAAPVDRYEAKRGEAAMEVTVFAARVQRDDAPLRLSTEHDAARWVTADEFRALTPFARLADAVDLALMRLRAG